MQIFLFIITVFAFTYLGIRFYLEWCIRKEIYDIPNERSSHTDPTPRGGGLVFVIICLTAFFTYLLITHQQIIWAYFIGALLVSGISWLDDLFSISIIWRFLCHSVAAGLVLFYYDFPQIVVIPIFGDFTFSVIAYLVWFLWIVWLINAYNFMDGIDGIAGVQALLAGFFWSLIGFIYGSNNTAILGLTIAVSAIAFLIHNWQPAKIFMGDVGSAFLGFNFAVLPLIATQQSLGHLSEFTFAGVVLVWFFVFDSGKTLVQRIFQRKRFWEAHREHLFQKLIIEGFSHSSVSLIYGALTILVSVLLILFLSYGFPFGFLTILGCFIGSIGLLIWVEFFRIP